VGHAARREQEQPTGRTEECQKGPPEWGQEEGQKFHRTLPFTLIRRLRLAG